MCDLSTQHRFDFNEWVNEFDRVYNLISVRNVDIKTRTYEDKVAAILEVESGLQTRILKYLKIIRYSTKHLTPKSPISADFMVQKGNIIILCM